MVAGAVWQGAGCCCRRDSTQGAAITSLWPSPPLEEAGEPAAEQGGPDEAGGEGAGALTAEGAAEAWRR